MQKLSVNYKVLFIQFKNFNKLYDMVNYVKVFIIQTYEVKKIIKTNVKKKSCYKICLLPQKF